MNHGASEIQAFEPSSNMYPLLKQKFDLDGRVSTKNALFGDWKGRFNEAFDSVLYVNVLEHIELDAEELRIAHGTIKKDGFLLIFVPALSWLYSDLDQKLGHYRRYHKRALCTMVSEAGFEITRAKYFDLAGIIPWYLVFVLLKKTMTGGNVSLYDRLVVPFMRQIETRFAPPIGKNILLVAKKIK